MTNEHPFEETIYTYSRARAIEDGVLVDLSHVDTIRQHWKDPFACTAAVWSLVEEALEHAGQDVCGICHDISTVAKLAIQDAREAQQVLFAVIIGRRTHSLKLHIGPGDTAAPVLTLMLPYED